MQAITTFVDSLTQPAQQPPPPPLNVVTIAQYPLTQRARASLQAFISNYQSNDAVSFYSNFIIDVAVGRGCISHNDWILVSDAIGLKSAFHQFVVEVAGGLGQHTPRIPGSVVIVAFHEEYRTSGSSKMKGVLSADGKHAVIPVYITGDSAKFMAAITRLTPNHIVMQTSDISLVTKVRNASLRVKQRLGFLAQTTVFIPDGTIDLHLPVISAARFWNTVIVPRSHLLDYIQIELNAINQQPPAAPLAVPIALPVFVQQPPAPIMAQGVQQPPAASAATQSDSCDGSSSATSTAMEIPEGLQQPPAEASSSQPHVQSQPPSDSARVNVKDFVHAFEALAKNEPSETPILHRNGTSESSDSAGSSATSTAMEIPEQPSDPENEEENGEETSDDEKTSAHSDEEDDQ